MKSIHLISLACVAFLIGCSKQQQTADKSAANNGRLQVYATNYPLAYFAERISGTELDVIYLVPKDVDPAFWQPTDAQIADFQKADLILMNGATYSKWSEKVSLPEAKTVDTSARFKDKFIEVKDAVTHSHGKQGEHSHNGTAFTTWLDFEQATAQAEAICSAFQRLKPESIEMFALNFDLLKREALSLDNQMKDAGKKLAGQPIVASHPVYQYWARRYGINLRAVLWEPEDVPTDAQMEDLKQILAAHPAKIMVWEGNPAKGAVDRVKILGLGSVAFDPCANRPEKGDWLAVMNANVKAISGL